MTTHTSRNSRFLFERDRFGASYNVVDSENAFKPITDKTMSAHHAVSLAKRMNYQESALHASMDFLDRATQHLNDIPLPMFDAHKDAERILSTAFQCIGTDKTVYTRQQANGRVVAYRG